jgi:hypothetical protein
MYIHICSSTYPPIAIARPAISGFESSKIDVGRPPY